MTHFHDADIKKALLEIAPHEKESIEASKFGEITGRFVSNQNLYCVSELTIVQH